VKPELGLFGPTSTTWRVSREIVVLLGGGARALMLQVAHPKVAAAVADHSRYRSDPLGRLSDTLNAIYGFTFADMRGVERILDHVHHLHTHVYGHTPDDRAYSALDPHLLLWVYATLIDSSLLAYETFVSPLAASERDVFYAELRSAAPRWGIRASELPGSLVDLRAWMANLIASGEVRVSPQARSVGRDILEPRVWWVPRPVELLMRELTVWLLPPPLRMGFGYTWGPRREQVMSRLSACSRTIVPRLPHIARDLPVARAAYARVRRAEARVAPAAAGSAASPSR
jgi:uncharacterized protein (DUF2236 family)